MQDHGQVATIGDQVDWFAGRFGALRENIELFMQGKRSAIEAALVSLLTEGHLLVEDVPGVGKTSLAKALALSIDGELRRIQFTPDLLPSDVTGASIFDPGSATFEFHPGGVFANVVLADEINRASPKTQSALLEVMEERQVTVDSDVLVVPRPFIVIATQNPVEHEGTYQLPEAQLDRFLMRITIGYPDLTTEMAIARNRARGADVEDLHAVVSTADLTTMIAIAQQVHLAEPLLEYVATLVAATRNLDELRLGVSPRGTVALTLAARTRAAAAGRPYVTVDDVKALAEPVLAHRMLLAPAARLEGMTASTLLADLLARLPVPDRVST
ncbi:MAG: MoxR family ATPase [Actinomycetota bacterium]|nr:MoxR family ATPase [Actinomycetota bacterium]